MTVMALISDRFCVATSGPTVDGRNIKARWLQDIGETYDKKVYEAMLWYEHYRWTGNYGSVHSVTVEKGDDGLYRLYNRLIPTPQMQALNRYGQKLHTSIEVLTEFRGKKKAYQYGLGITDSPASTGTDRLAFSAGGDAPDEERFAMLGEVCQEFNTQKVAEYKKRVEGVNRDHLEIFVCQELPDLEFSEERKVFDFGNLIGGLFGRNNTTTEEGTDDMNEKETSELIDEKLEAFGSQLTEQLKKIITGTGDGASGSDNVELTAKEAGELIDEKLEAFGEKLLEKIGNSSSETDGSGNDDGNSDGFTNLSNKFDALINTLSKISDGQINHSEADGENNKKPIKF